MLIADALRAEQARLDDLLADLDADAWSTPTPSAGWDIKDQLAHLALVDEFAHQSAADPERFAATVAAAAADSPAFEAALAQRGRTLTPAQLLDLWRDEREAAVTAVVARPEGVRLDWFGPSMSARSFLTARLMETWSHGHDVFDALGVEHPVTDDLQPIAELGVRTRGWSYVVHGETAPDVPVAVRLTAPSGATWSWSDEAAEQISGPAVDFCLVVTQRRHWRDTALTAEGPAAVDWLDKAQAFAGPATTARRGRGSDQPALLNGEAVNR